MWSLLLIWDLVQLTLMKGCWYEAFFYFFQPSFWIPLDLILYSYIILCTKFWENVIEQSTLTSHGRSLEGNCKYEFPSLSSLFLCFFIPQAPTTDDWSFRPRESVKGNGENNQDPLLCQTPRTKWKTKSSFVLNTVLLTNIWPGTLAEASNALIISCVYRINIFCERCRSLCAAQVFTQGRNLKQVCLLLECLFLWTKSQDIDNNK